MTLPVLQTATDTGLLLVLLVYLGILVSVALSLVILIKGIQGYRKLGDPALAGMAGGILLLSGVPLLVNLVLTTTALVEPATASVFSDLIQLSGLGLILFVIYRTGS